ncbi:StAR-related lipid transfer protein 13 [Ophiophagus hannah]|uniref:StAR-related lipid transfer protein 13 n=1 Tax=Ophiophagus hannah TaxID=8665 RepID=V8PGD8_OPHHA|nr:StAR-related lipid transfer protein 13 [Ophiophagus hannah]
MILTQIESKEACDWLKAAGFPQYAQMFADMQFPVDIKTVRKDHEFLDQDAIESLYRRLNTLNKYAEMKMEISKPRKRSDESEDEEPCAISNKWTYEKGTKRWSHLENIKVSCALRPDNLRLKSNGSGDIIFSAQGDIHDKSSVHSSSSGDSDIINFPKICGDVETSRSSSTCSSNKLASPDSVSSCSPSLTETLNMTSEDKNLDKLCHKKGNSFLKKMEKLRLRSGTCKKQMHLKTKFNISEPILLEGLSEEKLRSLNCIDISDAPVSRVMQPSYYPQSCSSSSSSSQSGDSSTVSTPSPVSKVRRHSKRGGMYAEEFDPSKLSLRSDFSEQNFNSEICLHKNKVFQVPQGHKPGTFPKALTYSLLSPIDNTSVNWRTGSFHGCQRSRDKINSQETEGLCDSPSLMDNRLSIYDNVPENLHKMNSPETDDDDVFTELDNVMEHVNGLRKLVSQWTEKLSDDGDSDSASYSNQSTSPCPSSPKEIHLEIKKHSEEKSAELPNVDGEDSCRHLGEQGLMELTYVMGTETEMMPTHSTRHGRRPWSSREDTHFESLSLQMDSQSATCLNRMQKLALLKLTTLMDKYSPSSKQGWNWTIPKFIRKIKVPDYKDKNVFGVPLLEMNEINPNNINYEGQSAFDVADMLKQYFRDLPEPIFTSKLCETFLHIYQYLPKDQQFCAVQAAILLLPDENREALKILLYFLRDVVTFVEKNQMTPTNIAVCLAPSLFHLNTLRRDSSSSSRSSQRKLSTGKPDQRDLSENLAATHGLAHMIMQCHRLFGVPNYCFDQEYENEHNQADLGEVAPHQAILIKYSNIVTSLEHFMQDLLREAKDKFKNWVTCSILEGVDSASKKVDDNYHIRLWKTSVEIDAVPKVILHRILMEQHLWDPNLQQTNILEILDDETDIYQYTTANMSPLPSREYVVLRTWRTDPQSGTCVLAATSTDNKGATVNGILAQVILYQGRTTEWYKRAFGHICAADMIRIKNSFKASPYRN